VSSKRYQDPVAYRVDYSLAAQALLAGSESTARGREQAPERLFEILDTVRHGLLVGEGGPTPDLEWARALSAHLVKASARELNRQGWRWPGRRPPWFVRYRRRPRNRRLAEFLDGVLEPATVALFWSCHIALGEDPWWETLDYRQPDRLLLVFDSEPGEVDVRWLASYLTEMLDPDPDPPEGWRSHLARLGVSRLRQRSKPNPRVRYNLACLYSRLAGSPSAGTADDRHSILLQVAAAQLAAALDGLDGHRREALSEWSRQDPGLEFLRSQSPFFEGRDIFF
jgi:hypothetical protein